MLYQQWTFCNRFVGEQKLLIYNPLKTLRPEQNGRNFANDIFKRIFINESIDILIKISMNFMAKSQSVNKSVLVPNTPNSII